MFSFRKFGKPFNCFTQAAVLSDIMLFLI